MTLSTSTASQTFPGNGVTQIFPCGFRIFQASDISVSLVDAVTGISAPMTLNSDYTLTGEGDQTGFTLSTSVPVATGTNLLVARNIAYTQPTDFTNQGSFFPTMHEDCADRLEMQIQQLAGSIGRSIKMPDGITPAPSTNLPLPSALAPLVWSADGTALENGSTSLTGDMLLRPDLASTAAGKGASLISLEQQGTGALATNIKAAILGYFFTPQMFGAVGDDVADDTAAVQAWLNSCALYGYKGWLPAVAIGYKLTAPITVTSSVAIVGDGVAPILGNFGTGVNTKGRGSWFHIAHTGIGFNVTGTANGPAFRFEGCGTYRDQVDPTGLAAGAWTPTVNGADFNLTTTDTEFVDCTLLNPTAGIILNSGGRLLLSNVKGQPISYFIDIVQATDVVRFRDVHLWPFWSNQAAVRDYQLKNTTGFRMGRCDNPTGDGLFTIGMYKGMEFYQAAAGVTAKGRFTNLDFDSGQYAVLVTGANVSAQFNNLASQGQFADTSLVYSNIQVSGSTCDIQLNNIDLRFATAACVRNQGSGSIINICNANIAGWNYNNSGYNGIQSAVSDAEVYLDKKPNVLAAGIGSTSFLGGAGKIRCPLVAGVSTASTDASGFITVTHGAGITPSRVFTQLAISGPYLIARTSLTSTTFQVQVRNTTTGSAVASTAITFDWQCEY